VSWLRRRRSLGTRVTAGFALSALLVSAAVSLTTYYLTRRSVLQSRQSLAVHQTLGNAVVVGNALRFSAPDLPDVLSSLETPTDSQSLLYQRGSWVVSNLAVGSASLPTALRGQVIGHNVSATMAYRLTGHAELAVGVALPAESAAYFEVFDLSDVSRTLVALALSLAGASAVATLLGAAIGTWATRRMLSPLAQTARAAAAIARGQLDTRLVPGRDSELADLAESFNAMVTALEQRIQRDARFASDVSHELRSPLTTLHTAVDVLSHRRGELPERSAQALDLLNDEVNRFERLVEDLLEVSRFDVGAADLSLEEVEVAELVRQALGHLGHGGVPVVVRPGGEHLEISADKRRLERVLANLLTNAEAHGGGATQVEVGPMAGGAYVAVDDAGPGVPPESRELIFERFARGRAAGRRAMGAGVGLGLSLVREHVKLHRGRVVVTDSPEGGARFLVELPADPEKAPLESAAGPAL
jgi:two-component system sensor histidine kinase MtrB